VTSTNPMMRRLGRRWKQLHRLIYVIAILGVWHFYWQVKLDTLEPTIYAAILAALLGYRAWRAQGRRIGGQSKFSRRARSGLRRTEENLL
jgi:sulfoxide reductase heme-binding subunit YedZ